LREGFALHLGAQAAHVLPQHHGLAARLDAGALGLLVQRLVLGGVLSASCTRASTPTTATGAICNGHPAASGSVEDEAVGLGVHRLFFREGHGSEEQQINYRRAPEVKLANARPTFAFSVELFENPGPHISIKAIGIEIPGEKHPNYPYSIYIACSSFSEKNCKYRQYKQSYSHI
jgi:hypothetical protein